MAGSSPLTRGKLLVPLQDARVRRLIPARAGKTHETPAKKGSSGAHPRSRGETPLAAVGGSTRRAHPLSHGENGASGPSSQGISGSSPLTRGKRDGLVQGWRPVGLIPAHAGKTVLCRLVWPCWWAHPRSCGENTEAAALIFGTTGSSPLMRGKRLVGTLFQERVGLIPAHAGKRACTPQRKNRERLIPAHAGKTLRGSRPPAGSRAHPHARGENMRQSARVSFFPGSSPLTRGKPPCSASYFAPWGSSPLMRGKPSASSTGAPLAGLIPAHAGKTARRRRTLRSRRAHSRSCGDNFRDTPMPALWSGSSPLTRGKRLGGLRRVPGVGLIPTHAGKTPDAPSATFVNAGSSPLTRGKR